MNGFGSHRIEGIGDKHVPWIHNVKNTDVVTAVDDEDCMRILRLFNEKEGHNYLKSIGVSKNIIDDLHLIGISGIGNMISSIKTAKYFEMTKDDIIVTIATDSADMYKSRVEELSQEKGKYNDIQGIRDYEKCILGTKCDFMKELNYHDRKAIHNLKYFTWVEQQGKSVDDLNQLWYDRNIWNDLFHQDKQWDKLINEFNGRTGLLKKIS
jgi:cysteine synthase A